MPAAAPAPFFSGTSATMHSVVMMLLAIEAAPAEPVKPLVAIDTVAVEVGEKGEILSHD